ncbi:unnamed protein product [Paramecium pentaurelia]|uniref:Transmembrane protein n=1 Tax=Paramecium pentaurelia TaxID=43138 RepID=A0A8S1SH52_9CILI|nr:unnamed protein product [Paramecium pentaurelia]
MKNYKTSNDSVYKRFVFYDNFVNLLFINFINTYYFILMTNLYKGFFNKSKKYQQQIQMKKINILKNNQSLKVEKKHCFEKNDSKQITIQKHPKRNWMHKKYFLFEKAAKGQYQFKQIKLFIMDLNFILQRNLNASRFLDLQKCFNVQENQSH